MPGEVSMDSLPTYLGNTTDSLCPETGTPSPQTIQLQEALISPPRKPTDNQTKEYLPTSAGKQSNAQEARWNFSNSRHTFLSLDQFLEEKRAAGFTFFSGKEPWLKGIQKLNWQTFFRVCTQEMDDISERALRLVIDYCLEIIEEIEAKIPSKSSRARLEAALDLQWAEQYENKVFQYRWALRHPVINEAVTRALNNRFPSR